MGISAGIVALASGSTRCDVAEERKGGAEMAWTSLLKEEPTPWLLEPQDPPVRYGALRHLLDRGEDDPEVREARAAIPLAPPASTIFAAQRPGGWWGKTRDYYTPKHHATFWTLSVLGDLGLTAEDERVRRGCDFMFDHQRENGAFCRRRRVSGKGFIWVEEAAPCTHARIVRFLAQFGYGDDPRVEAGFDWLLGTQRPDGMWMCDRRDVRRGCLRATLDYLRAAILRPDAAGLEATGHAAEVVADLLMEPRMSRYHTGGDWETLEYPYFGYSVLSALEALIALGHTPEHPKVAAAVDYLLSRQRSDGTWPMDQELHRPPADFGRAGEPSKWITLDALCTLKSLHGAKA